MSRAGGALRVLAWLWTTLLLALAVLTLRMVLEGEHHLEQSDVAFDRGDLAAATLHARRAALSYAPGAPHVAAAYERLGAIAVGAETTGQVEAAVRAWQAMRDAALETRHLWIPHRDDLARANAALLRLTARRDTEEGEGRSEAARREAWAKLDRRPGLDASVVLGLMFGLVAAAAGFGYLAVRGVDAAGRVVLGPARLGAVLAAAGIAIWTAAVLSV